MSIAQRLLLLILVAVLSLTVLVGSTLYKLLAIHDGIVETNTNSIPSIVILGDAQAAFLRARPPLLSHMLEAEPEKKAAFEKRFHERVTQADQALADYEKLVVDAKDREMLENSKHLLQGFKESSRNVLKAANEGRIEEAKHLLAANRNIIDGLAKSLDEHGKYNQELAAQHARAAEDDYRKTRNFIIALAVATTILMLAIGYLVYRQVSGSLQQMIAAFVRIERELDFTTRIPATGKDEISAASRAFNQLLERLQQSFRQIAAHTTAVNSAANRVSTAAHEMSIASGQQSDSAASMAAAIEELTVSINHVADRADETAKLTHTAGQLAREGESIIGDTVGAINSIAHSVTQASQQIADLETQSGKISNIVQVIREIADQTNLLALNAAIEAARAGEQGRGFAVVADEVRKLAERTGLSTQEIASTIQEMLNSAQTAVHSMQTVEGSVGAGVGHAGRASTAMQEIGSGSTQTVGMVSDISDSIREQSEASTTIAQQVESIAQMTEENSAAAQSTSDTAGELAHLASEMQGIVNQYRV